MFLGFHQSSPAFRAQSLRKSSESGTFRLRKTLNPNVPGSARSLKIRADFFVTLALGAACGRPIVFRGRGRRCLREDRCRFRQMRDRSTQRIDRVRYRAAVGRGIELSLNQVAKDNYQKADKTCGK